MRWNVHQQKLERRGHSQPSFKNPLFTKQPWQHFIIERLNLFIWLFCLAFLSIIYALFYSPLLQISRIEVRGTVSIPAEILDEKFIRWQLEQRRFAVFSQRNILLFSKSWLAENISNTYSTESLSIDKKLPHTLIVDIVEKKPQLVWQTGDQRYYLSEQGIATSSVDAVEAAGNIPSLTDESGEPINVGDAALSPEKLTFITSLIAQSNAWDTVAIIGLSVANRMSVQLNVHTEAGYAIYFDMSRDLEQQVTKLERILDTKVQEQQPTEYIDLRIGDRVYIK
ncbi:MAG: hypothetical protein WC505_02535 [Patescibacteria group bacterium]